MKELIKNGYEYNYSIELKQIYEIASKPSNVWLLLQGFFMNITTGTLIWLPTLYISKIEHQGYSTQIAIIAAGYLFALLQTGGLTSSYFGYLGDVFQEKSYRGRALLTAVIIFLAAILYIIMFTIPMKGLILPSDTNPIIVLLYILKEIALNPWMTLMFVLSFLATAAQSANTPNWLALITDVNLPEHRSAFFSLANLISGLGRSIGNIGIGFVLAIVSTKVMEPENYIITLIIFQLFLIPAALCYIKMSRSNTSDIKRVKMTLRKRAKRG